MKLCHTHSAMQQIYMLHYITELWFFNAVLYNDTQISELKAKSFLKQIKIDISS